MTNLLVNLLGSLLYASVALAGIGDAEAIESARDALTSRSNPWYDSQNDELRRVDVKVVAKGSLGNRDSSWEGKARTVNTGQLPRFNWQFSGFWRALQFLFWALLVILLIALVALLVWAFLNTEGRSASSGASDVELHSMSSDIDRVENLPFQVKRPNADLLAEARRQYEAGNFGEAVIYLFSYMLVKLDRQQVIHLAKGKTNRQYLREVRQRPPLMPILETTMIAFEDVFFGNHALDRQRFEDCWNKLDEFHQHAERQP